MDRTLELSPDERKIVRQLLKNNIGIIRQEIRHTDSSAFKDDLRKSMGSMQKLLVRIEEMGPLSELSPPIKKTRETRLTPYA